MTVSLARRTRLLLLITVTAICATALNLVPPIPQPHAYHVFADRWNFFGIPNFANVMSNLPFLVVGILGILFLLRNQGVGFIDSRERWAYFVVFAGVALTSFGSAYYHLAPSNDRLVWDRLPMTLVFMAFLAAMIAERISVSAGLILLPCLLALGIASVWYWQRSEQAGAGDLRLYAFVQFFPLLAIPLMVWLFPERYTHTGDLLGVAGFYILAKIFELLDASIFRVSGVVSGHTLKHLAAALATWWILRMLAQREPVSKPFGAALQAHI